MAKFVPRQRKHKVLRRTNGSQSSSGTAAPDSNAAEILPTSQRERDERRQKLRDELRAQQPKMSGKKQKRLDKYIETKLKKEENLEIMKRLASSKVDTSLLRSSKMLGRTRESKREILGRALRERERGVDVDGDQEEVLFQRIKSRTEEEQTDSESEDDYESDEDEENATTRLQERQPVILNTVPGSGPKKPMEQLSLGVGSGLKRPLDIGDDGNPLIPVRARKKSKVNGSLSLREAPESEWEGFNSEAGSGAESDHQLSVDEETDDSDTSSIDDESAGSSESSDECESEPDESRQQRTSAFKAWATQQINESLGFQPSANIDPPALTYPSSTAKHTPRAPEQDPLPAELQLTSTTNRVVHSVPVSRTPDMMQARLSLPVVAEEQKIMEAVHANPVVVIWGATGSGKTTQIPQFLYESGYGSRDGPTPGMIGITQPRRVAAVSMARRVGEEMGDVKGREKVAYKIRFEGTVKATTAIKFMTDGILLREAAEDITLKKYSAIIIDEAHERTRDTDILIGMMSRIIKLRDELSQEDSSITPLKLIIMSATLRISDFTENKNLFAAAPPLVRAEGRQHPVTIQWARRTNRDYLDEVYRKVCKAHKKLPPGGILVFLTGQSEITQLSKRLKEAFPASTGAADASNGPSVRVSGAEAPLETEDLEIGGDFGSDSDSESVGDLASDEGSDSDADFDVDALPTDTQFSTNSSIHVLPLYSLLPTSAQLQVFQPPPDGSRLIVLSTNIAETSLTIPNIRYVVDTGRAKSLVLNPTTSIRSFEVGWISKASASQRAGRAGRTGPGHCWRLYSSAVYERDFEEFSTPEILRTEVEGVVLQLKGMNVPGIISRFPFPTPPDRERLEKAERLLTHLGALSKSGDITPLGTAMSALPLSPRFAKILLSGRLHACLPYTIALVAALSVSELFIPDSYLDLSSPPSTSTHRDDSDGEIAIFTQSDRLEEDARSTRRKAYKTEHYHLSTLLPSSSHSDALKLLAAVILHSTAPSPSEFCTSHFLRPKALQEAAQLRSQLHRLLLPSHPSLGAFSPALSTPTAKQVRHLRQVLASGYVDHLAIRADIAPVPPPLRKPKRAIDVAYIPLFPLSASADEETLVYLHPSSALAHLQPAALPHYVVYAHLQRAAPSTLAAEERRKKVRMFPLTAVDPTHLAAIARGSGLLEYGKPVKIGAENDQGTEREVWVVPSVRGESGSSGWPLPAVRIRQRKERGRWVTLEET